MFRPTLENMFLSIGEYEGDLYTPTQSYDYFHKYLPRCRDAALRYKSFTGRDAWAQKMYFSALPFNAWHTKPSVPVWAMRRFIAEYFDVGKLWLRVAKDYGNLDNNSEVDFIKQWSELPPHQRKKFFFTIREIVRDNKIPSTQMQVFGYFAPMGWSTEESSPTTYTFQHGRLHVLAGTLRSFYMDVYELAFPFNMLGHMKMTPEASLSSLINVGKQVEQARAIRAPAADRKPITQKAKGILYASSGVCAHFAVAPCPRVLVLPIDNMPDFGPGTINPDPLFARPCPLRPRHGFVESQPVGNPLQAMDVFTETLREEPGAEMVLMPVLSGVYSGIANNAGVTWATGNDGATAGTSANFMIPAPTDNQFWNDGLFYNSMAAQEKLGIKDTAYVELVENKGWVHAVQYRDGPAMNTGKAWVNRNIERVSQVWSPLSPTMDLLQWERDMKFISANMPGAVVCIPFGTLSSHFAVQAISHNIPTFIGEENRPAVGSTILAADYATSQPEPLQPADYRAIADMLRESESAALFDPEVHPAYQRGALLTGISMFATQHQWGRDPHLLTLRAMAPTILLRFTQAACGGELRHYRGQVEGRERSGWVHPDNETRRFAFRATYEDRHGMAYDPVLDYQASSHSRNTIFKKIFLPNERGIAGQAAWLKRAEKNFTGGGWGGSYGGRAWGQVAIAGQMLATTMLDFIESPDAETWSELISAGNVCINTEHNNGAFSNKWVSGTTLSLVQQSPGLGFMNGYAAALVIGAGITDSDEGFYVEE